VVSNDTMVENPIISNYLNEILKQIEKAAIKHSLPIKIRKTTPRLEDSFWVNLIGKGYPAPNNSFRWCTERLKIRPTARFVNDILNDETNNYKSAIILLGTRKSESANRSKSFKKHEKKGKRLMDHPSQKNAMVYSPIKDMVLEEVWYIINTFKSPWGAKKDQLFDIYANASADDYECPTMVSNKDHKSCGQSRFGCWTCTVVTKDKSISAQIENGEAWMKPLRDVRNWILAQRNVPKNRSNFRRDGSEATKKHGGYVEPHHRAKILERIFKAQKKINDQGIDIELITNQELIAIQVTWYRDLFFVYKVADIYIKVFKKDLDMKQHNKLIKKEEKILLRRGLIEDIENRYKQFIAA